MNIQEFAEAHRLKVTKDDCDDAIIQGRIFESNIYTYSEDGQTLGVMFITPANNPRVNLWKKFRTACLEVGMTQVQGGPAEFGSSEGAFTFDSTDRKQAKVAINGIRARAKKVVSPEQAAAFVARLAIARAKRLEAQ